MSEQHPSAFMNDHTLHAAPLPEADDLHRLCRLCGHQVTKHAHDRESGRRVCVRTHDPMDLTCFTCRSALVNHVVTRTRERGLYGDAAAIDATVSPWRREALLALPDGFLRVIGPQPV